MTPPIQNIPIDEFGQNLIGNIIDDKWEVIQLLGSGGMADVFLALHVQNACKVALKVLHSDLKFDQQVRERFLQEAFASNWVNHPGTVAALDNGELRDGTPYLVLEYLEGQTLDALWERAGRRLSESLIMGICDQVLEVLEAAHAAGVLHRDVKPENIFITLDRRVKLLDFGIAKVRNSQMTHATQTGTAMGSPAFMPPEQARGRWHEMDAGTDLWAVSASVFTLLTGRTVHQADRVNEMLLAAMTQAAPAMRSVAPQVNPGIAALIDKGLQYDRAERFQSATEMRRHVAGVLELLPPVSEDGVLEKILGARASQPGLDGSDSTGLFRRERLTTTRSRVQGRVQSFVGPSVGSWLHPSTAPPPRSRHGPPGMLALGTLGAALLAGWLSWFAFSPDRTETVVAPSVPVVTQGERSTLETKTPFSSAPSLDEEAAQSDESSETTALSDLPLADEAPSDSAPVKDAPVKDAPVKDAPMKDVAVEDAPVKDAPMKDVAVEDVAVEDAPVEDAPVTSSGTKLPASQVKPRRQASDGFADDPTQNEQGANHFDPLARRR